MRAVLGKFFLTSIVPLLICGASNAKDTTYFDFHPMSALSLGAGLNSADPADVKLPCATGDVEDADGEGALYGELTTSFVSSAQHVRDALNIDTKIEASYLIYKGSSSFNFDQLYNSDERTVTVVVRARNEFSRRKLVNVKLTSDADEVAKKGDWGAFVDKCGTHVAVLERRGVMVAAIITLRDVSEKTRKTIRASISASGGYGPVKGSAKAAFQSEMERARDENRIDVNVVYSGGEGTTALSDLVKASISSNPNLDNIAQALADFSKTLDKNHAAPLGYHVTRMPGLDSTKGELWSETKEDSLVYLVSEFRRYQKINQDLDNVISGFDERAKLFPVSDVEYYKSIKPKVDDYVKKIAISHANCKQSGFGDSASCRAPERINIDLDRLPAPLQEPTGAFRIAALENKPVWSDIDSWSVLAGPAGMGLLDRAKKVNTNADFAAKVFVIKSYFLDSMRLFIEPEAETKKRLPVGESGLHPIKDWARLEMPRHLDGEVQCKSINDSYITNYMLMKCTETPIVTETDPLSAGFGIPETPYMLMREVLFPAYAKSAAMHNVPSGSAVLKLETLDQLKNRTEFVLYRFNWILDPSDFSGKISIQEQSDEPPSVISIPKGWGQ